MDCFYLAFKVPNLLRDLFAEGALSQAFVTTFSKKLKSEGEESAWALANKMMTLAAVFMSLVTLLGILAAPWIVDFLTSLSRSGNSPRTYNPEEIALTVTMVRVMYPFILLVSLAALVMGMLNARNVFGMPALSSCFFNLGSMIGGAALGWWMDPDVGAAKPDRLFHRRGDRRAGAVGLPVSRAAAGGLPVRGGFPMAGLRRPADPETDGPGGDRRLGGAGERGDQRDVRLRRRRGRGELAELCVPPDAAAHRRVRRGGGHGDPARAVARGGGRHRRGFQADAGQGLAAGGLPRAAIHARVWCCWRGRSSACFTSAEPSMRSTACRPPRALRAYGYGLLFYAWLKVLQPAFYAIDKRWLPMMVSIFALGAEPRLQLVFRLRHALGPRVAGAHHQHHRHGEFPDPLPRDAQIRGRHRHRRNCWSCSRNCWSPERRWPASAWRRTVSFSPIWRRRGL